MTEPNSIRAVARRLDTSPSIVHRDLRAIDLEDRPGMVTGLDGKRYPASAGMRELLRTHAVRRMLEHPDWSLRQVAASFTGLISPATVLTYRRQLDAEEFDLTHEEYTAWHAARSGVPAETPEHMSEEPRS